MELCVLLLVVDVIFLKTYVVLQKNLQIEENVYSPVGEDGGSKKNQVLNIFMMELDL